MGTNIFDPVTLTFEFSLLFENCAMKEIFSLLVSSFREQGQFCVYHVQSAYKKSSAKRSELQGGSVISYSVLVPL